jgi:hypothetical protein
MPVGFGWPCVHLLAHRDDVRDQHRRFASRRQDGEAGGLEGVAHRSVAGHEAGAGQRWCSHNHACSRWYRMKPRRLDASRPWRRPAAAAGRVVRAAREVVLVSHVLRRCASRV